MCDKTDSPINMSGLKTIYLKKSIPFHIPLDAKIIKTVNTNKGKRKSGMPCKLKRKAIDKVHLSMDNSSLSTTPENPSFPVLITNDDDDTEKYLTKYSKKPKLDKTAEEQESKESANSIILDQEKLDNDMFEPPSMQVIKEEYGDRLVMALFPDSETNDSSNEHNGMMNASNSSFGKMESTNELFLDEPFTTTNDSTSKLSSSHETNTSDILYSPKLQLAAGPSSLMRVENTDQSIEKSTSHIFKKVNNDKRGSLSASVEQVDDPVRNLWVTTRSHKEQLKESGHTWTVGMWSKEEVSILRSNIDRYCKERGICNPEDVIFNATKDERKDFYPTVCMGLNRPLFAVYRRVKRMYNKRNYKGRYTTEEVDKLKDLQKIHGHDWAAIARELDRSSDSVKDRFRLLKKEIVRGKWTDEEEQKLAEAVHEVTRTPMGAAVTEGISWSSVAEKVETRSEKQCRIKWQNFLNWKLRRGGEWTREDDKLLVQKIAALNVQTENQINWHELSVGWTSARSASWLRKKWVELKKMLQSCNICDLNFTEIVGVLNKIFTEEVFNIWDRPKQMLKLFMRFQETQNKPPNPPKRIKSLAKRVPPEEQESDNITTCVISQTDETTTAPLFIQTADPDHLMSSDLCLSSSVSSPPDPTQPSLNAFVRPRTSSESTQSKTEFDLPSNSNDFTCESTDSALALPQDGVTYRLTPTSSEGVFIIEYSDGDTPEDVTLATSDNRFVNITMAIDVLKSVLKLGDSDQSNPNTITLTEDGDSVYLKPTSDSTNNPTLSSVAHDVTIDTQGNSDDVCLFVP